LAYEKLRVARAEAIGPCPLQMRQCERREMKKFLFLLFSLKKQKKMTQRGPEKVGAPVLLAKQG
jgi:hypothetical protein